MLETLETIFVVFLSFDDAEQNCETRGLLVASLSVSDGENVGKDGYEIGDWEVGLKSASQAGRWPAYLRSLSTRVGSESDRRSI